MTINSVMHVAIEPLHENTWQRICKLSVQMNKI